MDAREIRLRLAGAVTAYDRRREKRPDYNRYALPQYLGRVADVCEDIAAGAAPRAAILAGFHGPILLACLKAIGESAPAAAETNNGRSTYQPASARP